MRTRWLAAAVLTAAVSCASSGSSGTSTSSLQSVPIISDPTGATARAGDQAITTPGSILVPKGARFLEVTISKDGYETATVILTPDSRSFRDCFTAATDPNNPPPNTPFASDSGVYTLGARLLAILAGCTADSTQVQLQPNLVFVKLQPLPPIPTAPPRAN
jgi:hypothetical protein